MTRKIYTLDCTLRDGGYCNDCLFGFDNAKKIVAGLVAANIDIIECGFFATTIDYDPRRTRFSSLDQVIPLLPAERQGKLFVLLADHGRFSVDALPPYDGTSIDGLRIAFHKKDRIEGLDEVRQVKEKGYKTFVQAMVAASYSDAEFLDLIHRVNAVQPYAFYIVDSFGMMKSKDLTRLFYLVENNLDASILIGFHSHNNLQLSYSHAQHLVHIPTKRNLIIDSSVYGMGRGAGNLNTELFIDYLNDNAEGHYLLPPLLNIIDEILSTFYHLTPWGYSLPNYLSAVHNTHPNYARYLDDKKTVPVEVMNILFEMMSPDKRVSYDKEYIEELYLEYMATGRVQETHKAELQEHLHGKRVLLIAPGRSSHEQLTKITSFAQQDDVVTIGINFDYPSLPTDFIFLSNLRRYKNLPAHKHAQCIVTANIPADDCYLQTPYRNLLTGIEAVRDNAGLMAIKFLMDYGVDDIYLAGFDGYSYEATDNYADSSMALITRRAVLDDMNEGMSTIISHYAQQVHISFLTVPQYVHITL